jgi:uncharacterized protein YhfF
MSGTDPRVAAFWQAFLDGRSGPAPALAEVFAFDDNVEGAAVCAAGVLSGEKVATSSLAADYPVPPRPGDHAVVTELDGTPRAVIEYVSVGRMRFGEADEAFARAEGDGTLENWLAIHRRYYGTRCAAHGTVLDDDTELMRMFFRRVWPRSDDPGEDGAQT